ncbi:YjcZ family sporulation protein [Neobacillus niacini]|nr:YjcZ family sporulation protein [Neobacillus niacini]
MYIKQQLVHDFRIRYFVIYYGGNSFVLIVFILLIIIVGASFMY